MEFVVQCISCGLAILTIIGYFIYNTYRRSIKPSKYMLATQKLGFIGYEKVTIEQQQEAILKIFQLAGYFNLENIWHDLNNMGNFKNVQTVFDEISSVVKYSRADQSDPTQFNATYMRNNLFKTYSVELTDVLDWMLYISQHAFARKIGQERYELTLPKWLITSEDYYLEAARQLRLVDREYPTLEEYDGCWIAGAARFALSLRIIDYNYYIYSKGIKINGETLVLAGEREVWANIDGISPAISQKLLELSKKNTDIDTIDLTLSASNIDARISEGQAYMMRLAQFYNIRLCSSKPFIEYTNKDECPPGRFPNRIYANYDDANESSKLTETLLAQDLLRTYSNSNTSNINIIDTSAEEHVRPDTASTARDATERLVKRILAGKYGDKKTMIVLFCTNNPSIERQTLATQRQVNQVFEKYGLISKGYQIKIEGVGFSFQQRAQLAVVHSEFGALITEKYQTVHTDMEKNLGITPKRDINRLLFQTRDKNIAISDQSNTKTNHDENLIRK